MFLGFKRVRARGWKPVAVGPSKTKAALGFRATTSLGAPFPLISFRKRGKAPKTSVSSVVVVPTSIMSDELVLESRRRYPGILLMGWAMEGLSGEEYQRCVVTVESEGC